MVTESKAKPKTIVLIVDDYNTGRGPLTRAVLEKEQQQDLKKENKEPLGKDVVLWTAGIKVGTKQQPDKLDDAFVNVCNLLYHVDISEHRPAPVNRSMLNAASLVLAADPWIKNDIIHGSRSDQITAFPNKVLTVGEILERPDESFKIPLNYAEVCPDLWKAVKHFLFFTKRA